MERFTPEQIREYNDAFVMFDNDGSGDILVSELRDMLKTIGFNPKDNVLEIMTIVIDEVFIFKLLSCLTILGSNGMENKQKLAKLTKFAKNL